MKFKDIIRDWLKENGYTGLFYPGECACSIDDLMPCENPCPDCEAGYLIKCTDDDGEDVFRLCKTKKSGGG